MVRDMDDELRKQVHKLMEDNTFAELMAKAIAGFDKKIGFGFEDLDEADAIVI